MTSCFEILIDFKFPRRDFAVGKEKKSNNWTRLANLIILLNCMNFFNSLTNISRYCSLSESYQQTMNHRTYIHNILRKMNLFLIILKVIHIKKIDICFYFRPKNSWNFFLFFRLFYSIQYHNTEHVYVTLFLCIDFRFSHEKMYFSNEYRKMNILHYFSFFHRNYITKCCHKAITF